MSFNFPKNLLEATSSRKLSGTQVEVLSCMYLKEDLAKMGYDAILRLEGKESTVAKMLSYAEELQGRIDTGAKKSSQVAKEYAERKNFAKVTSLRLADSIKKDIESYPNMYTVYIDSAGYSGEGSTKADFDISYQFNKIEESVVVKNLQGYAISHKYNQEESMGTQINSVYGTIYSLSTGKSAKVAGPKKVRAYVNPLIERKFGKKGGDMIARLHDMQGNKSDMIDTTATEKEYQKLQNKFYNWLKEIVEDNHLNLLKFIGIEEGVDHFMAAFVKGRKRGAPKEYKTFSSIDSKKYKDLVDKCYDEAFRKDTKCVATVTDDVKGHLDIKLLYKNKVFYETHIRAEANNSKKSKHVVGGIKAADMDDSEVEHEFKKFAAEIPNGLEAFMPPDKPKANAKKPLKRLSSGKTTGKVPTKISQKEATSMWSKVAIKTVKDAGGDPHLKGRIVKNREKAVQYIMAGLSAKEAINQSIG